MSPIRGMHGMICRPAGFSDDDEDEDEDSWNYIRAKKIVTKPGINPRVQLEDAIKDGNLEAVKAALENGASVQYTDAAGYTGLMLACSYGHSQIVQYLVEQRSQVNACTNTLIYPLMVVCFSSCKDEHLLLECVQTLIKEYVNINAVDVHGTTALMFACKSGRCLLVKELVSSGANVHMLDTQKWNALHHAANSLNAGAVEILLAAGAKKYAKDCRGRRPFQIAMTKLNSSVIAASLCPKRHRHMLVPERKENDVFKFQLQETAFQSLLRKMDSVNKNLNRQRPKTKGEQLNLYEFLTTTDEELQALGMERSWHRRQTLEYIKEYMLQPWERLVQPRLSKFGQAIAKWNSDHKGIVHKSSYPRLTYVNSAHLVLGVATRLQVIQASAKYTEMHLIREEVDETIQQQIKLIVLNIGLLENEIQKLMDSLRSHDHEPIIPADLVVSRPDEVQKRNYCKLTKIFGAISIVSLVVWKIKATSFFK